MLKDEYKVYEDKMKKSIEAVISDFDTVRAGRANASVLNRISVDYYGTPTPINQIAAVSVAEARVLDTATVRHLVDSLTQKPWLGLFGTEKVNVLRLNVALEELNEN